MRLGVLDVGSNTVHLLVVDAHAGARPIPAASDAVEVRLAESLTPDGLSSGGVAALLGAVRQAALAAEDLGVEEIVGFATSAVRDAPNGPDALAYVLAETGVALHTMSGDDEARLTFLAVRRWFGWSAGRLLVVDIGGGSLEVAVGIDEQPDAALSLPLGAGRLTRSHLSTDQPDATPDPDQLRTLRRHVRTEIGRSVRAVSLAGAPDLAVGTSKTLRSLGRIAGVAPYAEGPYVRRVLARDRLKRVVAKLTGMSVRARAGLPGVSSGRAAQVLAGAVVADALMDLYEVQQLELCPWALREGVILRRLDAIAAGEPAGSAVPGGGWPSG